MVADRHDLGAFATARWTDFRAPFFAEAKVRVDEGFTQIDLAAVPEVLGRGVAAAQAEVLGILNFWITALTCLLWCPAPGISCTDRPLRLPHERR